MDGIEVLTTSVDAKFDIKASELMKENPMKLEKQLEKLKALVEDKQEMAI